MIKEIPYYKWKQVSLLKEVVDNEDIATIKKGDFAVGDPSSITKTWFFTMDLS